MEKLTELSKLIKQWNRIESKIFNIIGEPGLVGHIGEYIAEAVFGIELEKSKTTKGFDGRFKRGNLRDRKVNVKTYPKRESFIDWRDDALPEYFLILSGPKRKTGKGAKAPRPITITNVHLFDVKRLRRTLKSRGIKIEDERRLTVQASVKAELWNRAEVYPRQTCKLLQLTGRQKEMLALFG